MSLFGAIGAKLAACVLPAVEHGVGGWKLIEYDWDPRDGLATFLYEHDSSTEERPVTSTKCKQQ